jgi:hypothetical protein
MSTTLNAQTRGFALAVAATSILSALLVMGKELNEGLLKFMKAVTVHHWVTHGIFDLIVFVALGLLLSKSNSGQGPAISDEQLTTIVVSSFLLSNLAIAAFFIIHG